jgi:DHA1 family bicyclomycin/chloramphenicol resistance-like MFS transporter
MSPALPPEPDTRPETARRLIPLLIAMSAVGPLSLNILVPALPTLVAVFATDPGPVQLTISLYLLGLAVSQLALGPLSDRFGRRPVVLAGLALTAVASIGAAFATSIGMLIMARLAQSFGGSTGLVIGRVIIRDLVDRNRAASMLGLVTTVMVVVPMIGPLIGGLLDTAIGWQGILLFVAALSLVVLAWAALALPETRPERPPSTEPSGFLHDLKRLAASKSFAGYVLSAALGTATFFVFLGGSPYVIVTLMGRSSAEYGIWFAISSIGFMAGNFAASRWSLRHDIDTLIWWGIVAELVGVAVATIVAVIGPLGGPITIFGPQMIISFGNGLLLPNAIAGAVSVRPQAAGAASGITGCAQMGLGAAVTQLSGHVLAGASSAMPMALMMAAIAAALTAAFLLLLKPTVKRDPSR